MRRPWRLVLGSVVGAAACVGAVRLFLPGPFHPVEEPVGENVDLYGDPLPPGAVARCGTIRLRAGGDGAFFLQFTPDGRHLLSWFHDRRIAVFDAEDGRRMRLLRGHRDEIDNPDWTLAGELASGTERWRHDVLTGFHLAPDGESLVTTGYTVRRCALRGGSERLVAERELAIQSSALFPDGGRLAFEDYDGVYVMDLDTGEERTLVLNGPDERRRVAGVTRDGGHVLLVRVSSQSSVPAADAELFAVGSTGLGTVVAESDEAGLAMSIAPDGGILLVGSDARLLPAAEEHGVVLVAADASSPIGFKRPNLSPDGTRLVLHGGRLGDSRVVAMDVATGAKGWEIDDPCFGGMVGGFSPDGTRCAIGGAHGAIAVVRVADGKVLTPDRGHVAGVCAAALFPDGRRVVTFAFDGSARIWEVATGRPVASLAAGPGRAWSAAVSRDGRRIRAVHQSAFGKEDARLTQWAVGVAEPTSVQVLASPAGRVSQGVLDRTGDRIACLAWEAGGFAWGDRGVVTLHPIDEVGNVGEPTSPGVRVERSVTSPSGDWIVWSEYSATAASVLVAPTSDPTSSAVVHRGDNPVGPFAVADDGRHVALCVQLADGFDLLVVERASGARVLRSDISHFGAYGGSSCAAQVLRFSPDGSILACGRTDGAVDLLAVPSGELLAILVGHIGTVRDLLFAGDGRRLVSGGDDTTAMVWDLDDALDR